MTTTTDTEMHPRVHYRTLCGNLTRDPELRFSAKGTAWCTCAMAVNPRRRLEEGSFENEPPQFYDLVCFGDLAEHVAESLSKGDRVVAFGKVEHEIWTDSSGGERTTTKLLADDVGPSLRFVTAALDGPPRRSRPDESRGSEAARPYPEERFG